MFTVLDGEIELTFRGVSTVATAGETINVPANAPHVFRNVSQRPARLLCLCSPAGQEEFFKEVGVPVAHRTEAPPDARRCRHRRVHRQGDRTRPEVPDRAAARRAEALSRVTDGLPVVNVEVAGVAPPAASSTCTEGRSRLGRPPCPSVSHRTSRRVGARPVLVTVNDRLAPDHPHPAAIGAATLVALKQVGPPQPSAAALMPPWADRTLGGTLCRPD